ncbi:MAG: hypothetical protein WCP82_01590 [Alphaproteobacteria bacterium]|jgi:hypothetical protein
MTVPVAWIHDGEIYSHDPEQDGKFWIDGHWIWGPRGAADLDTKHWIDNNWIWGPVRGNTVRTQYFIQDGWIYGPTTKLPFA